MTHTYLVTVTEPDVDAHSDEEVRGDLLNALERDDPCGDYAVQTLTVERARRVSVVLEASHG
jgi:hypothetical protein